MLGFHENPTGERLVDKFKQDLLPVLEADEGLEKAFLLVARDPGNQPLRFTLALLRSIRRGEESLKLRIHETYHVTFADNPGTPLETVFIDRHQLASVTSMTRPFYVRSLI